MVIIIFSINDYVMYSYHGICKVTDILEVGTSKEKKMHYVLHPMDDTKSTLMTPIDNKKVILRYIITKEEAQLLMECLDNLDSEWIPNNKQRMDHYAQIARNGDVRHSLCIFRTLLLKQSELKDTKKKLSIPDDKIFHLLDRLLCTELAYALNEDVPSIHKKILSTI